MSRILIIEDDTDINNMMADALRKARYECAQAFSGTEGLTDMLSFLGAQYLLNLGIAALILFFCTLTKSSAFSMTAGIMMVMGLFIPIYSIINRAVYEIKPSWDFDISLLVPDGNIGLAGIHASSEILVRATAVGAVYVILCSAAAVLIMKKRDVR